MRFKCFDPAASYRAWSERRQARAIRWHKWFAWRPVKFNNRHCVWLETIWRVRHPYALTDVYIHQNDDGSRPHVSGVPELIL